MNMETHTKENSLDSTSRQKNRFRSQKKRYPRVKITRLTSENKDAIKYTRINAMWGRFNPPLIAIYKDFRIVNSITSYKEVI